MAYSTNIYDLYKKVEENHMEIHQRLHEAKKITKKERDKLENDNQHGELALKLAQSFGTPQEVKKIKDINKRHMKAGSIDPKDQKERDAISNKYYKMAEEVELDEMFGISSNSNHRAKTMKMLDDMGVKYKKDGRNGLIILGVSPKDQKGILDKIHKDIGMTTYRIMDEEVELDEKVDMQTKSYINDIARAMTKDKLMKPFADKFKKDAMKTGKPKDSLEDVLPDYIAGKDIAKLLNMGEETELDERFSPKEIKMAIGIASDPRYAKGNMTGAVKAIEKMKRGLSDHPQVAAVLKRQNEGFASDAQRRAAFAQGYKAKGKKGKKEEVKEKLMNAYRQQWKELGEKRDPADIDVKATSKDQEMADQNVVMQLRRAGNLGGTKEVKFGDGKKVKVKPQIAQRVMSKMMTLRTTQEKEKFQKQIGKSYRDLLNALK